MKELRERTPIEQARQETYFGLLYLADQWGYKPGWAAYKFKILYLVWPDYRPQLMTPFQELLFWCDRQKKKFKAERKKNEHDDGVLGDNGNNVGVYRANRMGNVAGSLLRRAGDGSSNGSSSVGKRTVDVNGNSRDDMGYLESATVRTLASRHDLGSTVEGMDWPISTDGQRGGSPISSLMTNEDLEVDL